MARRNRQDYLTKNRRSPNWYLNFRVPETHQHLPEFEGKGVYQVSTQTSDYKEACSYRDAFFTIFKLFGYGSEEPSPEAYWRHFSGAQELESFEDDDDIVSVEEMCKQREALGLPIPEPYQSIIQGHRNRQRAKDDPLATIQHPFPLTLSSLYEGYKAYRGSDFSEASHSKLQASVRQLHDYFRKDVIDLSAVTKHQIFGFVQDQEKRGYSASTIRNTLSFLGRIYDYAQLQGLISDERGNPFKDQPVRTKNPGIPRNSMPLQYAQGLFEFEERQELRILTAIGHYTGVRLSEAYSGVIEINGNQISLRVADDGGKTKAATRQIPLHDHLWEILQESRMLDTETGKIRWTAPNADSLGKRFGHFKRRYFEGIGVDDKPYVFHSFRHAFSTYLVNSFSELKASELTGHDRGSSSATELGRTYYKGLDWEEKKVMIQSLPSLDSQT